MSGLYNYMYSVRGVLWVLDGKTDLLTGLLVVKQGWKPCCPDSDQLQVQVTQSYPNRLRFLSLPCPQSLCHSVIYPVLEEGFFSR